MNKYLILIQSTRIAIEMAFRELSIIQQTPKKPKSSLITPKKCCFWSIGTNLSKITSFSFVD